jgi:hypothetical protein
MEPPALFVRPLTQRSVSHLPSPPLILARCSRDRPRHFVFFNTLFYCGFGELFKEFLDDHLGRRFSQPLPTLCDGSSYLHVAFILTSVDSACAIRFSKPSPLRNPILPLPSTSSRRRSLNADSCLRGPVGSLAKPVTRNPARRVEAKRAEFRFLT